MNYQIFSIIIGILGLGLVYVSFLIVLLQRNVNAISDEMNIFQHDILRLHERIKKLEGDRNEQGK